MWPSQAPGLPHPTPCPMMLGGNPPHVWSSPGGSSSSCEASSSLEDTQQPPGLPAARC